MSAACEQPVVGELGAVGHQLLRRAADADQPALGLRAGRRGDAGDVAVGERRGVGEPLLDHVHHDLRGIPADGRQRLDGAEELLRERVDHEREAALAAEAVGVEHARLETGRHDHVEQVVVGELAAAGDGDHHRLEDAGGDRDVERLRHGVEHHVDVALREVGEPVVRDRRGDDGLAGEVVEVEGEQLVEAGDDDVAVRREPVGQRLRQPAAGSLDPRLDPDRQSSYRPHRGLGGEVEERVRVDLRRHVPAQQRVGELQVRRVLAQDAHGLVVVEAAEDERAGVGEVARHLVLHVPDGPLLQHAAQRVAVGDGHEGRGPLHLVDGLELAVVQAGGARFADAGDGDGVGEVLPLAHEVLGGCDITARAEAHQTDAAAEEGDRLVVVALRAGEAHVDDEQGPRRGLGRRGHRGSLSWCVGRSDHRR